MVRAVQDKDAANRILGADMKAAVLVTRSESQMVVALLLRMTVADLLLHRRVAAWLLRRRVADLLLRMMVADCKKTALCKTEKTLILKAGLRR